MKIAANKFVSVTYDLNVGEGGEQELMERASVEAPLSFIFGTDSMLPAFEKALAGLEVGATYVPPRVVMTCHFTAVPILVSAVQRTISKTERISLVRIAVN